MKFKTLFNLLLSALFIVGLSGCAHDSSIPTDDTRVYGDGEKVKK
jgi:hypothetical protein